MLFVPIFSKITGIFCSYLRIAAYPAFFYSVEERGEVFYYHF